MDVTRHRALASEIIEGFDFSRVAVLMTAFGVDGLVTPDQAKTGLLALATDVIASLEADGRAAAGRWKVFRFEARPGAIRLAFEVLGVEKFILPDTEPAPPPGPEEA